MIFPVDFSTMYLVETKWSNYFSWLFIFSICPYWYFVKSKSIQACFKLFLFQYKTMVCAWTKEFYYRISFCFSIIFILSSRKSSLLMWHTRTSWPVTFKRSPISFIYVICCFSRLNKIISILTSPRRQYNSRSSPTSFKTVELNSSSFSPLTELEIWYVQPDCSWSY